VFGMLSGIGHGRVGSGWLGALVVLPYV
jgi:hypothetical protein